MSILNGRATTEGSALVRALERLTPIVEQLAGEICDLNARMDRHREVLERHYEALVTTRNRLDRIDGRLDAFERYARAADPARYPVDRDPRAVHAGLVKRY